MRVIPHMHSFVSDLSAEAQQAFQQLSTLRKVGKGEAVYRRDDPPIELFQLVEGNVKLCNYTPDGKEIVAGEFHPGDCFGEMGILDQMPRVSCVVATSDSIVRVLGKERFETLVSSYPEVMRKIAVMLCLRVRYMYVLLEEASELTLHQRVACTVLRLAYGRVSSRAEGPAYIATSQEQLAHLLGVTRQSVNKELKALQQEGAIELRYGRIYILDLELLETRYANLLGTHQITPGYDEPGANQESR